MRLHEAPQLRQQRPALLPRVPGRLLPDLELRKQGVDDGGLGRPRRHGPRVRKRVAPCGLFGDGVLLDGATREQLRRVRQRGGDGGGLGAAALGCRWVQSGLPAGDLVGGDEPAGVGFGAAGALLGFLVFLVHGEHGAGGGRLLDAGAAARGGGGVGGLHATAIEGVHRAPGVGAFSAVGGGRRSVGVAVLGVVIHRGDLADAFEVLLARHAARVALVFSARAVQGAVVAGADDLVDPEAGFLGAWTGQDGVADGAFVFCRGRQYEFGARS